MPRAIGNCVTTCTLESDGIATFNNTLANVDEAQLEELEQEWNLTHQTLLIHSVASALFLVVEMERLVKAARSAVRPFALHHDVEAPWLPHATISTHPAVPWERNVALCACFLDFLEAGCIVCRCGRKARPMRLNITPL